VSPLPAHGRILAAEDLARTVLNVFARTDFVMIGRRDEPVNVNTASAGPLAA
jgi:hypothetical protein